MSSTTVVFPDVSKEEWIGLLTKELKGEPIETLHKQDEIEGISFPAYMHKNDAVPVFSDPGLSPYVRGHRKELNEWVISCPVYLRNQSDEEANRFVLDQLMKGNTGIYIIAETERAIDFGKLLQDVGLEHIYTTFEARTAEQASAFQQALGTFPGALLAADTWPIVVNAYAAQQAGANVVQELTVALCEGHDAIVRMLDRGMSIDEVCKNIRFHFGIGTKYLIETAKFRAFRWCWSTLIAAYQPEHECTKSVRIAAISGFTHLSLKDPYTNLLRQTTQAMSAINGGADELVVQPYDAYSSEFNPTFSQRMATNISLLLQEESFFAKVQDVAGGSYAIEHFTNELATNAWEQFKAIEAQGGLDNATALSGLTDQIRATAALRKEHVLNKRDKLIGVNCFPNPKTEQGTWTNVPAGWNNLPTLLLDTVL